MEYCQEPVLRAKTDDESVWAGVRECHSCGYSFCSFCKRTWHGPHTPCPEPVTSKIVLAYLATSEDGQIRLEQHYGRASLQRMERQHQENEENRKWLESSTTKCPGCALRKEYGLQSYPLLLPLWEQDISDEFVPTLFDVWNELLFEVIRLRAKRRGRLAANRGI
ncbi:hypothetical protein EDD17DRAFT_1634204 [Pisolithus thermaeus]|nr:hypothetical protein EDD17DRAFT_1634204 [Pisolithus thermaeus]